MFPWYHSNAQDMEVSFFHQHNLLYHNILAWRAFTHGDLDPDFLRTSAARQLLDASYALWEATHGFVHAMEMFERIIDIASGVMQK